MKLIYITKQKYIDDDVILMIEALDQEILLQYFLFINYFLL